MKRASQTKPETSFPLDSSAVIHLAAHRPDHANTFRFHAELHDEVDPAILQRAVDAVAPRFPTIVAGIQVERKDHRVVSRPTLVVQPDTALLAHMSTKEIERCAMRILHGPRSIALELFHSITDGHGAIVFMNTLLATYFEMKDAQTPFAYTRSAFVLDPMEAPREEELSDDYPAFAKPPATPPNRRRVY